MANARKRVLILSGEASGDHHAAELVRATLAICSSPLKFRESSQEDSSSSDKEHYDYAAETHPVDAYPAPSNPMSINPNIHFFGMGGEKMREAGVEIIVDAKEMAVVGAIEILAHIRPIYHAWKTLRHIIKHDTPDLLVLLDYPEFNLQMAKAAKKAGVKVLYYISPQVWAWKRKRVHTIKERVNKMLVIFPFEEIFYKEAGVPVEFVGHPLAGKVKPTKDKQTMREQLCPLPLKFWGRSQQDASSSDKDHYAAATHPVDTYPAPSNPMGINIGDRRVIGLLPGSRKGEIKRLLPVMLESAEILKKRYPDLVFLIPLASSLSPKDLEPYLAAVTTTLDICLVENDFYNTMQLCEAAIVTSGTATLETALLTIPMAIAYKTSWSTYQIVKRIIHIPYIGLCNIVAGKQIVKEFIQDAANVDNLSQEIAHILEDNSYREEMIAELQKVKDKLGVPGGSEKAARALIELLES
jgi:lipid-A-disaccharide synthase